jgi:ubiquinol-cytochrome c reductase cytochrome c1 subunit
LNSNASLQNGAKIFVNYCLGCHSAVSLRYNRLRDIGLSDQQIKDNLILGDQKVGDLMTISMNPKDAKAWFGKVPPDLSVEARARGTDWL